MAYHHPLDQLKVSQASSSMIFIDQVWNQLWNPAAQLCAEIKSKASGVSTISTIHVSGFKHVYHRYVPVQDTGFLWNSTTFRHYRHFAPIPYKYQLVIQYTITRNMSEMLSCFLVVQVNTTKLSPMASGSCEVKPWFWRFQLLQKEFL